MMDPKKKKENSLKHDRRNTYGENDKASRKSIPKRKQWVNKAYRRNVKQKLATDDLEAIEDDVADVQRPAWKKQPDQPLGEVMLNDLIREISSIVRHEPPDSGFFQRLEQAMAMDGWETPGIRVIMRQLRAISLATWSGEINIDLATARELIILIRNSLSKEHPSNASEDKPTKPSN